MLLLQSEKSSSKEKAKVANLLDDVEDDQPKVEKKSKKAKKDKKEKRDKEGDYFVLSYFFIRYFVDLNCR